MGKVVLTCGVFDLFHRGHAEYLRKCARFGDRLVVAIMTDRWVEEFKGRRPVYDQESRARIVESIKGVSDTLLMDTIDPTAAMEACGCSIFVHGNDWLRPGEDLDVRLPARARAHIIKNRVVVVLIPYTEGISTTAIRIRLSGERMPS